MDRKFLEDRLRELGLYSTYYHRLELKTLAQLMQYDEKLNCVLTGVYGGSRKLCAVTDYRILIVGAGVMSGGSVAVIPRKTVESWVFEKKILLSSVCIVASGRKYEIKQTQAARKELFDSAMSEPVKEFDK